MYLYHKKAPLSSTFLSLKNELCACSNSRSTSYQLGDLRYLSFLNHGVSTITLSKMTVMGIKWERSVECLYHVCSFIHFFNEFSVNTWELDPVLGTYQMMTKCSYPTHFHPRKLSWIDKNFIMS